MCILTWANLVKAELISRQELINLKQDILPSTEQSNTNLPPTIPNENNDWLNKQHKQTKSWLKNTVRQIDNWFGKPNPDKPASANLRLMIDGHYNEFDNAKIEPRIRGQIKLPTLERQWSILIGDDIFNNQEYNAKQKNTPNHKIYNQKQSKKDNRALALQLTKIGKNLDKLINADIGIRSTNDIYIRLKNKQQWQIYNWQGQSEQMYRYGSQSKHYVHINMRLTKELSSHESLANYSYMQYSDNNQQAATWGNNLYQTHQHAVSHGYGNISYGVHISGYLNQPHLINTHGFFATYRRPMWRDWLFVQSELNYYNNKALKREHYLIGFMRLEAIF